MTWDIKWKCLRWSQTKFLKSASHQSIHFFQLHVHHKSIKLHIKVSKTLPAKSRYAKKNTLHWIFGYNDVDLESRVKQWDFLLTIFGLLKHRIFYDEKFWPRGPRTCFLEHFVPLPPKNSPLSWSGTVVRALVSRHEQGGYRQFVIWSLPSRWISTCLPNLAFACERCIASIILWRTKPNHHKR